MSRPQLGLLVWLVVGTTAAARAEHQFGAFLGWSHTSPTEVDASYSGTSLFSEFKESASRDVDFKDSASGGLGWKMWFSNPDVAWLGVGADLYYFGARGDDTEFHLVPAAVSLLGRYPLFRDAAHPQGVLRPYLGVGLDVLLFGVGKTRWAEMQHKICAATSPSLGWHAVAGVNWVLSRHNALFLEYRYTYLPVEIDEDSEELFIGEHTEKLDTELSTRHLWVGWTFLL